MSWQICALHSAIKGDTGQRYAAVGRPAVVARTCLGASRLRHTCLVHMQCRILNSSQSIMWYLVAPRFQQAQTTLMRSFLCAATGRPCARSSLCLCRTLPHAFLHLFKWHRVQLHAEGIPQAYHCLPQSWTPLEAFRFL